MEILAAALLWPFLLLLVGFVFVFGSSISGMFLFPMALAFLVIVFGMRNELGGDSRATDAANDLDKIRRGAVVFSIILLLPMFTKYLLAASSDSLLMMILGLLFGFGVIVWGMLMKNNKVLSSANVVGGVLTIIYLYFQLWNLGQLAQVIATAFGLVAAVVISVIKFRDKLI
jgi:hypothetical protein